MVELLDQIMIQLIQQLSQVNQLFLLVTLLTIQDQTMQLIQEQLKLTFFLWEEEEVLVLTTVGAAEVAV
tara:strand:+ start:35 stop:241 length:207 start_codon:yes stop_codon:yes gene_type:complete